MYCNFRVFINISKYLLKSVTFLATTIFIVIHTNMQEILFNPRVRLHSYLQAQFIQPTIERDGDNYSMSRSIQTNTFILKKKNIEPLSPTTLFVHAASVMGVNVFEDIEVGSRSTTHT